jgi:hypothetical protein
MVARRGHDLARRRGQGRMAGEPLAGTLVDQVQVQPAEALAGLGEIDRLVFGERLVTER